MDFDFQWLLVSLPVAFALGWLASRFDLRQLRRDQRDAPRAYFKGLSLLLNEQQDKAIDAFIEAVQHDPDTAELHFALGNLFRRRGEFERAVRVHEHLVNRADLEPIERDRARAALAQDFLKAGLFDRAEEAYRALEGSAFEGEARVALLTLYERSRDWHRAAEVARQLERAGQGSFASRVAHYHCELALQAAQAGRDDEADALLRQARSAEPAAARPLVIGGQLAVQRGRHAEALQAWDTLRIQQPWAFALVAGDYADAAVASGRLPEARLALAEHFERMPGIDAWRALARLEPGPSAAARVRLLSLLRQQPTLSAAQQLLADPLQPWSDDALQGLRDAVAHAARPLQRYRCAACGFEAQRYFWQCPGCLNWDSFPPQPVESQ